ncbi:hypothetical protein HMPREF9412_2876 [Paenibacillus sp. HGF5]|nr:hypothetical protein HMPREF9412_2876 [Paenibacillus sp. HGF5]
MRDPYGKTFKKARRDSAVHGDHPWTVSFFLDKIATGKHAQAVGDSCK